MSYLNLQFVTQSLRNAYGPARRCLLGLFNVKTCPVPPLTRGKEGSAGGAASPAGGARSGAEPPPPTAPGLGILGPAGAAEPVPLRAPFPASSLPTTPQK